MPRVSEAHLSARREQILQAAWRCFARNGFHGTSMQDIFAESGLSAGAVYRYFPSKLDLVKATAERVTQGLDEAFHAVAGIDPVPTPDETFSIVLDHVLPLTNAGNTDISRIALHVWSEALREPAVGDIARQVGLMVREQWAIIAARWKDAGYIDAVADPGNVSRLFYGILVGFVAERNLVGDVTPDQYVAGLAALLPSSAVLAEVARGDADTA